MAAIRVWRIKLDGRHRTVTLSHDLTDGKGYVAVDDAVRQCFGPRLEPTNSTFAFEIERRQCFVRIQLTEYQTYRYECEVNGTVLMADHEPSAPVVTLLRASEVPAPTGDALLRAAAAGSVTPASELLRSGGADFPSPADAPPLEPGK